jgi:hypothetical protein
MGDIDSGKPATGIRETVAKRAGLPVSAQKTRPVTMPLGLGAALEGVCAGQAAARSKVHRIFVDRTFGFSLVKR